MCLCITIISLSGESLRRNGQRRVQSTVGNSRYHSGSMQQRLVPTLHRSRNQQWHTSFTAASLLWACSAWIPRGCTIAGGHHRGVAQRLRKCGRAARRLGPSCHHRHPQGRQCVGPRHLQRHRGGLVACLTLGFHSQHTVVCMAAVIPTCSEHVAKPASARASEWLTKWLSCAHCLMSADCHKLHCLCVRVFCFCQSI